MARYDLKYCSESCVQAVNQVVQQLDGSSMASLTLVLDYSGSMESPMKNHRTRRQNLEDSVRAMLRSTELQNVKGQLLVSMLAFSGHSVTTIVDHTRLMDIHVDTLNLPGTGNGRTPLCQALLTALDNAELLRIEMRNQHTRLARPVICVISDGVATDAEELLSEVNKRLMQACRNRKKPDCQLLCFGISDPNEAKANFAYLENWAMIAGSGSSTQVLQTPEDVVRAVRFISGTTVAATTGSQARPF